MAYLNNFKDFIMHALKKDSINPIEKYCIKIFNKVLKSSIINLSFNDIDNVDDAIAEVVFAFRKDDMDNDDMDNMAAFGKIVKNYLKINNLYGSI